MKATAPVEKVKATGCRKSAFKWSKAKAAAGGASKKEAKAPAPNIMDVEDWEKLLERAKALESEGVLNKIVPAAIAKALPTGSAEDLAAYLHGNKSIETLRLRAHLIQPRSTEVFHALEDEAEDGPQYLHYLTTNSKGISPPAVPVPNRRRVAGQEAMEQHQLLLVSLLQKNLIKPNPGQQSQPVLQEQLKKALEELKGQIPHLRLSTKQEFKDKLMSALQGAKAPDAGLTTAASLLMNLPDFKFSSPAERKSDMETASIGPDALLEESRKQQVAERKAELDDRATDRDLPPAKRRALAPVPYEPSLHQAPNATHPGFAEEDEEHHMDEAVAKRAMTAVVHHICKRVGFEGINQEAGEQLAEAAVTQAVCVLGDSLKMTFDLSRSDASKVPANKLIPKCLTNLNLLASQKLHQELVEGLGAPASLNLSEAATKAKQESEKVKGIIEKQLIAKNGFPRSLSSSRVKSQLPDATSSKTLESPVKSQSTAAAVTPPQAEAAEGQPRAAKSARKTPRR